MVCDHHLNPLPVILDLTGDGLSRSRVNSNAFGTVYRFYENTIAEEAASIGSFWLLRQAGNVMHYGKTNTISVPGLYSISSIVTSYLGNPNYDKKAQEYASSYPKTLALEPPGT